MSKLLNSGNTKTRKGEKLGFITYGLHLAPAKLSGFEVCKDRSPGCTDACLNLSGHGVFSSVQKARIAKTIRFFKDKQGFMSDLFKEIRSCIKSAARKSMTPCFRLNLTSDLPWESIRFEGKTVLEMFPGVTFYDYTATPARIAAFLAGELPSNYHLTFSRKENTSDLVVSSVLQSGGNVAVVFRKQLPQTFLGFPVVSGDETDLRFLDGRGVVVGLTEKGLAKKDKSGFVLEPQAC
jgi:hypothetical protein